MYGMNDWAAEIPEFAIALARDFWPGPMTLVLQRSELAQNFITGNQETVGIRVPDHTLALALLQAFEKAGGKGIAAPSANRFGHVSPTTAQAVREELSDYLNQDDQILDGGPCNVGVESTIIDCTGTAPRILRPGAITVEMIEQSTGISIEPITLTNTDSTNNLDKESLTPTATTSTRVSGSLEAHYAPAAKVILDQSPVAGQGFIALANIPTPPDVIRLASPLTTTDFARDLYAALRAADEKSLSTVVVAQPNGNGLAIAIRDRLSRAANGR
jgi:L-threonylcarbamoyladenylate synthase